LGKEFVNNMTDELFELFVQSKIKAFSQKNDKSKLLSESLFGPNLTLKQLLNKQDEDVKKGLYVFLHIIYLYAQLSLDDDKQNKKQIEKLQTLHNIQPNMEDRHATTDKIYKLLNVEVNNETKTMIDDIVDSFNPLLDMANKDINPIASIMEISQTISSKYADKINKGDIELDKLMDSIKAKVPGMGNIIDNFGSMTSKSSKSSKPVEKVIIDENYSTAKIELGEAPDEKPSSFNIGKILKTADAFGVIPGGKKDSKADNSNAMNGDKMNDLKSLENLFKMINPGGVGTAPDISNMMNLFKTPEFTNMMKNVDVSKLLNKKN